MTLRLARRQTPAAIRKIADTKSFAPSGASPASGDSLIDAHARLRGEAMEHAVKAGIQKSAPVAMGMTAGH